MSIIVDLISKNNTEIKKFLVEFFDNTLQIDDDIDEWMYTFKNPLESIDMISAYADNIEKFDFEAWICVDYGMFLKITYDNINEIIKMLFERFYNFNEIPL
jgi:hypothetical protein